MNKTKLRETHKDLVFRAVKSKPFHTARELASLLPGLEYHEVMRRLNDLADKTDGRVHRGIMRDCSISKRRCLTWVPDGYYDDFNAGDMICSKCGKRMSSSTCWECEDQEKHDREGRW
jgi:hypothetical protein